MDQVTVTYNGNNIIDLQMPSAPDIIYNGETIVTGLTSTKTLNCADKRAKSDIVIGSKTLNCSGKRMKTNVVCTATKVKKYLIKDGVPQVTFVSNNNRYLHAEGWSVGGSGGMTLRSGYYEVQRWGWKSKGSVSTSSAIDVTGFSTLYFDCSGYIPTETLGYDGSGLGYWTSSSGNFTNRTAGMWANWDESHKSDSISRGTYSLDISNISSCYIGMGAYTDEQRVTYNLYNVWIE